MAWLAYYVLMPLAQELGIVVYCTCFALSQMAPDLFICPGFFYRDTKYKGGDKFEITDRSDTNKWDWKVKWLRTGEVESK